MEHNLFTFLKIKVAEFNINKEIQEAFLMCLDADKKFNSLESKPEELLKEYQDGLSIIMPFVKG
jgi:hypothetical protein